MAASVKGVSSTPSPKVEAPKGAVSRVNKSFVSDIGERAIASSYKSPGEDDLSLAKKGIALAGGGLLGMGLLTTGPLVYLHELGHAWAVQMTRNYPPGVRPEIVVDGFDSFKDMVHADSFSAFWKAFLFWISGQDKGLDGRAGYTTTPWAKPSALGEYFGADRSSAFVSLAGAVLPSILATSQMLAGVKLRRNHPIIGHFLIGMGGG